MATKRILIVDDDEDILDAISMMLNKEGYYTKTACSNTQLKQLSRVDLNLILLDVNLGGEDGRKICGWLKSREETKDVPVIILSASHMIERTVEAIGADDFLDKPFKKAELLDKIEKWTKN